MVMSARSPERGSEPPYQGAIAVVALDRGLGIRESVSARQYHRVFRRADLGVHSVDLKPGGAVPENKGGAAAKASLSTPENIHDQREVEAAVVLR